MRKEMKISGKPRISIYGSRKEIDAAENILNALELTGNEYNDRIKIQEAIDKHRLKADILYEGNTVWSYNRVIRDFRKALREAENGNGEYLTDELYKFFHLCCGSIAHTNKHGWMCEYPTKDDLINFCFRNEFGRDILSHQPSWASDRKRIAERMLDIAERNRG